MRKLIISAIAMAPVLATAAVANAQYFQYCRWVWNGYAWVWYCGF